MRTNWGCIGLVSPDVGLLLELMDAVRMGTEKRKLYGLLYGLLTCVVHKHVKNILL